jgi:hypothetical protein
MGGRSVRREPTLLQVIEQAREILHHLGWTEYFIHLQGYDTNVTLEFFQNLQGEISTVQGIQILVASEIIAEVKGLPNTGVQWIGKYTKLREAVEYFREPTEELDKKGKELNPSTLSESWKELVGIFQLVHHLRWTIRCNLTSPFKLLAALKQRLVLNLPFFLHTILHEVALRTQRSKDLVTVISHHRLVKLIVDKALSQNQLTWENMIEANRPPQLEQETTTQREIPPPQTEFEAEPAQITEAQTSQTQALTKRKKRTMVALRSPPRTRKRSKQTQETIEEI